MDTTDDAPGPPPDAMTLLDEAASRIVSGVPAEAFVAWFAAEATNVAPAFDAWLRANGDGTLDGGFARALWNRMPRPDERLHPRPLPAVGRNDPCPCGSGAKHKRCCLGAEPSVETLARLPLLLHVLDALPDVALDVLDFSGADPDALLETLDVWGDEGAGARVVRLVAPLFESGARLPRHAPELLEALFDHWPAGFRDTAFDALSERLAGHRDEDLASIAVLARVRAASAEEPSLARTLFEAGRRRFSARPEFEEAEIDLLNAEGRIEEATRLARTLGERLVAIDPALADHAEALLGRATWVDPELALERACRDDDVLDRLLLLLEETPPAPIAGSHAPIGAARELVLEPTPVLAALEGVWIARFGAGDASRTDTAPSSAAPVDGGPDDAPPGGKAVETTIDATLAPDAVPGENEDDALTRVVAFLDDEPLALSSFAVLDALARGAGGWSDEPWAEALQLRVFERGEALLYRHVSRELGFETPDGLPDWNAMVWDTAPRVSLSHPANRPALDLLGGLIACHRRDDPSPDGRAATLLAALAGLDR